MFVQILIEHTCFVARKDCRGFSRTQKGLDDYPAAGDLNLGGTHCAKTPRHTTKFLLGYIYFNELASLPDTSASL